MLGPHFRRFEILLPLRFNDGRPVPKELLEKTHEELKYEFGALSLETQETQSATPRDQPRPE